MIGFQGCDLFTNRAICCSKSHLFLSQWEWDSKTKQPIRLKGFFKLTNHIAGKWKTKKVTVWQFGYLIVRFQNWSNKVTVELRVKQFWSEIILVISARSILKSRVWFQTKLHSTQFNYHYKSTITNAVLWWATLLTIYSVPPLLGVFEVSVEGI